MHNATTKQRLSALRRKLGIFTGAPRWVRERRARLARLEAAALSALGFSRTTPAGEEVATSGTAPASGSAGSSAGWISDTVIVPQTGDAFPAPSAAPVSDSMLLPATGAASVAPVSDSMLLPATGAATAAPVSDSMLLPTTGAATAVPVSDSMLLPATGAARPTRETTVPHPPAAAPAEGSQAATEIVTRPDERRRGATRRIVAIAALILAATAGVLLAMRSRAPEPAVSERGPSAAQAPAFTAPEPASPAPAAPEPASPAPAAREAAIPAPGALEVRRGDTLWALAAAHLGDPMLWPRLHAANRDRIRDPDLIYPGQQFELPAR